MLRLVTLAFFLSLSALVFSQDAKIEHRISDEDRAIVAIALQDFYRWDGATFGHLKGALAVKSETIATPDATIEELKSLAPNIREKITDAMAKAHMERNAVAVRSDELLKDSAWAKLLPADQQNASPFDLRPNAKAVGSFTLPGISNTGTEAVIQIHHSWSIHGAVVTYVLAKANGTWRIVARDQTVFL